MDTVIQKGDPRHTEKLAILTIVQRWKVSYPEEYRLFMEGQHEAREGLHNDQGMDDTKAMAFHMRIPKKVLENIDMIFEGQGIRLEDDASLWKWFRESFPEFLIAKPRKTRNFI